MHTSKTVNSLNRKFGTGSSSSNTISKRPIHTVSSTPNMGSIVKLDSKSMSSYLEEGELSTDFSTIEESLKKTDKVESSGFFTPSNNPSDTNTATENSNSNANTNTNSASDNANTNSATENTNTNIASENANTVAENEETEGSPPFEPILPKKTVTACICAYYINETIVNPFFEYLFTWNDETKHAEFPKKTIHLQPPSSLFDESGMETNPSTPSNTGPNTNSTTPVKTQIMNECIDYILDLFDLHNIFNTTLLQQMFKGFIWMYESNTVYLFFNVFNKKTSFSKIDETTPPPKYKWAILDEIVNKQYIANKNAPVLPEIVTLFKENTFLNTLHATSSTNSLRKIPLEHPLSLYLCENQANPEVGEENTTIVWKNVVAVEDDYFIENTVNYPSLGDFYYFSSEVIETADTTNAPSSPSFPWGDNDCRRYAVFLNVYNGEYTIEESYIVKDTSTINKEQWKQYYSKTDSTNVSTIWFKDRGLQLWAIKYPNQFYCIS